MTFFLNKNKKYLKNNFYFYYQIYLPFLSYNIILKISSWLYVFFKGTKWEGSCYICFLWRDCTRHVRWPLKWQKCHSRECLASVGYEIGKSIGWDSWERSRKGHIKMNIRCHTLFTNSKYPGPSAFIPTSPTPENLALVSSSSQSSSHGGLESPR